MPRRSIRTALLVLVAAILLSDGAFAAPPVTRQDFARLHTLIKPAASEEKWTQVPWLVSLWDARQKAAAAGKPILLWEMDGHPLGCV